MARYRSWNGYLKKFVYFDDGKYWQDTVDGLVRERASDETASLFWIRAEQCIEYNDEHGHSIYVGDIVSHVDSGPLCTVIYDKGCFLADSGETRYHLFDLLYEGLSSSSLVMVFGNIHQNPELLGE